MNSCAVISAVDPVVTSEYTWVDIVQRVYSETQVRLLLLLLLLLPTLLLLLQLLCSC